MLAISKQIIVSVVLCFICFKLCKSCNKLGELVTCSSFEELNEAGSHPEWIYLEIKNSGNIPLQTVKNNAFINVPNLKILILDGIVNKFDDSAFKELNKLEMLRTLNNDISELPENLFDELHINYLAIEHSKLKSIPANYFAQMNNLEFIKMNDNIISSIGDCAFCNLKSTNIILGNNLLKTFDAKRILGPKSDISGLNLNGNNLTTVPLFGEMLQLIWITFTNNSIETFEDESLRNALNLSVLDLSFNKLKNIPSNALPDKFNNEGDIFIYLQNNNIACISEDIRNKFNKLKNITINDNPWNCECLNEMKSWAKSLNAFIGCDSQDTCEISCVDKQNVNQIITFD